MKSKSKYLIAGAALVVLLGGYVAANQSGLLQGRFGTSGSELTADLASTTPRADIMVAGTTNNDFSDYQLSASSEAMMVTALKVTAKGATDADRNFAQLHFDYTDSKGATQTARGYFIYNTVAFTALDLYVPAGSSQTIKLLGDLNPINSSGSSAVSGDKISLVLAKDGFSAVGETSGTTFSSWDFTATTEPATMLISGSKPAVTLDSTSPSGPRTVSAADTVYTFDVDSGTNKLAISKVGIDLTSAALFDTSAKITASLQVNGKTEVAKAPVVFTDSSNAHVTFATKLSGTGKAKLSLVLDTEALLNERSGVDDALAVQMQLGSATSAGNFWWSDGTTTFKWIGNMNATVLTGNTLSY